MSFVSNAGFTAINVLTSNRQPKPWDYLGPIRHVVHQNGIQGSVSPSEISRQKAHRKDVNPDVGSKKANGLPTSARW